MSTTDKGQFPERLRRLRGDADLKLGEFADKIGVHISAASHWECGRSLPDLARIPRIASVLGVTELQLVRGVPAWAPYEHALRRSA